MKPELIKSIPKYIRQKIHKMDLKEFPQQERKVRFYSYLTKIRGELAKITVAVTNYYKQWCCKQVAAHGVKTEHCLLRDINYFNCSWISGFTVGWCDDGCTRANRKWFEKGWEQKKFTSTHPWTMPINLDFVDKFKEYQYSAFRKLDGDCVVAYLKLYGKFPQVEFLLKFGLSEMRNNLAIVKRIATNMKFCKWLIDNKAELAARKYKIQVINKAFKMGKTPQQAKTYIDSWNDLKSGSHRFKELLEMLGNELKQFCDYLLNQYSDPNSYLDYLTACKYLRLDMTRPKNRYPSDFKKWHDRRIDEYAATKARADKKQRAAVYKQFDAVSEKYQHLQDCRPGEYAMVIARSPADLIHEGEILKHCVGKVTYEERVLSEESLIFFVRSSEKLDIPFVTVEYSPASKRVLQCYGYHSKRPDDTVLDYVNNVWLPYANKGVKKFKEVTMDEAA